MTKVLLLIELVGLMRLREVLLQQTWEKKARMAH